MNLFKLALKNIQFRWMHQLLTLLLFTLAMAILWVIHEVKVQSENKLLKNLAHTDLVIGAKGSPLQIILSSIYHIDAPTGNIPYPEAKRWAKHPMVRQALPLAYGDYYLSYKILGTDTSIFSWYEGKLTDGRLWTNEGEVVLGASCAAISGLKVGDTFSGQHGDTEAESGHGEYRVVGILAPSGTVLDQLVLCGLETVWHVHEYESGERKAESEGLDSLPAKNPQANREITALMIRYKNPMAAIQLPRIINENSQLQAAAPSIEINRLSFMLNAGSDSLKWVGMVLLLLATFSMLIQIWMGLSVRKNEFALLRSFGFGSAKLLFLLALELGLLVLVSFFLAEVSARWFIAVFTSELGYGSAYAFDGSSFGSFDLQLFLLPCMVVAVAVLLIARKIYQISIADLLQHP